MQIRAEVADGIAETLTTSQAEKEQFHRTAVRRLQQRYLATQAKLDRAYEDRLAGNISDELWARWTRRSESDPVAAQKVIHLEA